jgi:hypothetical protein
MCTTESAAPNGRRQVAIRLGTEPMEGALRPERTCLILKTLARPMGPEMRQRRLPRKPYPRNIAEI